LNVSPRRILITIGALLLAGLTGQFWAVRSADRPRRDFDAAGGLRLGLAAGAVVAPAQRRRCAVSSRRAAVDCASATMACRGYRARSVPTSRSRRLRPRILSWCSSC